jgi:ABC-type branched-subunit amino acid transport system ATPase component
VHLAGHGIARTLQGLGLFDRMTVLSNVMVTVTSRSSSSAVTASSASSARTPALPE